MITPAQVGATGGLISHYKPVWRRRRARKGESESVSLCQPDFEPVGFGALRVEADCPSHFQHASLPIRFRASGDDVGQVTFGEVDGSLEGTQAVCPHPFGEILWQWIGNLDGKHAASLLRQRRNFALNPHLERIPWEGRFLHRSAGS